MDLSIILTLPTSILDYLDVKELYVLSQVSKKLYQQTYHLLNQKYQNLLETEIFPNIDISISGHIRYCLVTHIKTTNFRALLGYTNTLPPNIVNHPNWIEDDQLCLRPIPFIYNSNNKMDVLHFPYLLYKNTKLLLNLAVIIKYNGVMTLDYINDRLNELNHQLAIRNRPPTIIEKEFELLGLSFSTSCYLLSVEGVQTKEKITFDEPDVNDSSIIYDLQFIQVSVPVILGYYRSDIGKKRIISILRR